MVATITAMALAIALTAGVALAEDRPYAENPPPQAATKVARYCSDHLAGRNSNLQRLGDASAERLSTSQQSSLLEMREFVKREAQAVRIPSAASRIRFHKNQDGFIRTDLPVTVIFHGLLNSPSWFQKIESTAFARGSHVLNIRLPGHYTKRSRDLDEVTSEEWMIAIREALKWASQFSDDVTFIGHSTGAIGGIIANAEQPGVIKKMLLFSPAFKVSNSLRLQIKATTALGLSGWIFSPPIDNERYFSSWAGIQVQRLSEVAAGGTNNYEKVLSALANTEVMWVDTALDKTLDVNLNFEFASRLREKAPNLEYVYLEKNIKVSHDQNGAFGFNNNRTGSLYSQVRDFLTTPFY